MTFKPTLACDADLDKVKFPTIIMTKIDGVRALNVDGKLVGRSLKPFKNKKLTEKYSKPIYSGMEGELIAGNDPEAELLCNKTTSVVNTINGDANCKWYVFDWSHPDHIEKPYIQRYYALRDYLLEHRHEMEDVILVPYFIVSDKETIVSQFNTWVEEGYEGAIIRDPHGMYKQGRVTVKEGSYLRMKPSSDKEAIVLDFVEAMQNNNETKVNELGLTERSSHQDNKTGKGIVGSFICKDVTTGDTITVGAGKLTHEEREQIWLTKEEYVGKILKYTSMDSGVKDKPRFPRWISWRSEEDMSE